MTKILVDYQIKNGVARIALNSPRTRNALSREMVRQLHAAFTEAAKTPTVRVVVLTHKGSTFCAGADLTEVGQVSMANASPSYSQLIELIWTFPKPVVAMLAGPARAGGLGLAAAADLVVAEAGSTFALTEVRIGVVPAIISAVLLARMSPACAHRALVIGSSMTAEEAARTGLIDMAAPVDQLDSTVEEAVGEMMLAAPEAFAATKVLVRQHQAPGMTHRLTSLSALSESFFRSDEAAEGIAAFRERRRPNWVIAANHSQLA
ncbi:enoyl-CoA hydratase-related protein [Rhodococcus qingshengii]|uniref:enoyl-CoA hydratase-related protein n=1 Tax=Rhodococcus qingshengii TaxID=334542 RepID=UPI001ABF937F|nr:enoyl-CoA hydratase-related protein [Rhodococcus qingshengii]